jgi:Domain of unknown function (DUF4335)
MESNHLTNHTYTAPTCTLVVASKDASLDRQSHPVNFSLEMEHSDVGELHRVTLQGQAQQLDNLHQLVNRYIAELVAKFPLPTTDRQQVSEPDRAVAIDPTDLPLDIYPDPRVDDGDPRSGIIKNLPGLRNSVSQSLSASTGDLQSDADDPKPSISKLLGRWQQPNRRDRRPDKSLGDKAGSSSIDSTTTPYLTESSERSVDHHFYLGDLATPASSAKLTLSAIQLFDLAAVLDEYAAEHVTTTDRSNFLNRASQDVDPTNTSRSRLPNLPTIPARTEVGQAYHRAPSSRAASFMSGIPWAVAAAFAVGLPLLLFDRNPNLLKDTTKKLKPPELATTTKATTATTPAVPDSGDSDMPTPWQAQPVQPPPSTNPLTPAQIPTAQDPGKIGLAPLPATILGSGVPTTSKVDANASSTIAPNPLTSELPNAGGSTITVTPANGIKAPAANPAKPNPSGSRKITQIGQRSIDPNNPGKVSLSTQPTLGSPAANAPTTPIPFDRAGLDEFGRIDPAIRSITPKKTNPAIKPTSAVRPNNNPQPSGASESSNPQASFEPMTPVLKNPNLIDPNQTSPEPATPQSQSVVPNQPLQSNAGGFSTDSVDNPSLEETKRYFQSKWKASNDRPNALQYVVQVKGKSGIVQSVAPQGAAATTYLQETKFIKPGQKLISPAAAGSSDKKIRVLLQPDGNVDTFIEP